MGFLPVLRYGAPAAEDVEGGSQTASASRSSDREEPNEETVEASCDDQVGGSFKRVASTEAVLALPVPELDLTVNNVAGKGDAAGKESGKDGEREGPPSKSAAVTERSSRARGTQAKPQNDGILRKEKMEESSLHAQFRAVTRLQEHLMEAPHVSKGQLAAAGRLLTWQEMEDVTVERSLGSRCGNVLCDNEVVTGGKGRGSLRKISMEEQAVYDAEILGRYCSTSCMHVGLAHLSKLPKARAELASVYELARVLHEAGCGPKTSGEVGKKDVRPTAEGGMPLGKEGGPKGKAASGTEKGTLVGKGMEQGGGAWRVEADCGKEGGTRGNAVGKKAQEVLKEVQGSSQTGDKAGSMPPGGGGGTKAKETGRKRVVKAKAIPKKKPESVIMGSVKEKWEGEGLGGAWEDKGGGFDGGAVGGVLRSRADAVEGYVPLRRAGYSQPPGSGGGGGAAAAPEKAPLELGKTSSYSQKAALAPPKTKVAPQEECAVGGGEGSSGSREMRKGEGKKSVSWADGGPGGEEAEVEKEAAAKAENVLKGLKSTGADELDEGETEERGGPGDNFWRDSCCWLEDEESEEEDKTEEGEGDLPEGFSWDLPPSAMLMMTLQQLMSAETVHLLTSPASFKQSQGGVGEDESGSGVLHGLNGWEYTPRTASGPKRATSIEKAFAMCLLRALPGVLRQLAVKVPVAAAEQEVLRLVKTFNFVLPVPALSQGQWRLLAVLFVMALSKSVYPGLTPMAPDQNQILGTVAADALCSLEDFDSCFEFLLPGLRAGPPESLVHPFPADLILLAQQLRV